MEPKTRTEALSAEPGETFQRLLYPPNDSGFAQAGQPPPDHGGVGVRPDAPDPAVFHLTSRAPLFVGRSCALPGGRHG